MMWLTALRLVGQICTGSWDSNRYSFMTIPTSHTNRLSYYHDQTLLDGERLVFVDWNGISISSWLRLFVQDREHYTFTPCNNRRMKDKIHISKWRKLEIVMGPNLAHICPIEEYLRPLERTQWTRAAAPCLSIGCLGPSRFSQSFPIGQTPLNWPIWGIRSSSLVKWTLVIIFIVTCLRIKMLI